MLADFHPEGAAGALPVCLLPLHLMERRCWVAYLNSRPWCKALPQGNFWGPVVLDGDIAWWPPHRPCGNSTWGEISPTLGGVGWFLWPWHPCRHLGLFHTACVGYWYPPMQLSLHKCALYQMLTSRAVALKKSQKIRIYHQIVNKVQVKAIYFSTLSPPSAFFKVRLFILTSRKAVIYLRAGFKKSFSYSILTFLRQMKGTTFKEESWVRQKPFLFLLLIQGTASSLPPSNALGIGF